MDTVPTKVKARDIVVTFDALRNQRDEARTERDALRTALTEVLAILKSGRSTGRTAIEALFAAEDVAMAALEPSTRSSDEYTDDDEKYLTTFGGMKWADE